MASLMCASLARVIGQDPGIGAMLFKVVQGQPSETAAFGVARACSAGNRFQQTGNLVRAIAFSAAVPGQAQPEGLRSVLARSRCPVGWLC